MTIKDLVRKARSTRRFDQSRPVPREALLALVDLARLAPSGGNTQPLRYRIVCKPEECQAIFPFIAWAAALKPWPGPAEGERPTGYILILGPDQNTDANTGIAAQTICLAAAEMGYGACMLGAIQRDRIKAALALPDPYQVKLAIALGVPAERIVIEEVSAGTDLRYYRTPDGVHHVPKLRLEDVLV
ncbi:MAG: nitroreductase family protein [Kiritimatiellia bacterium]